MMPSPARGGDGMYKTRKHQLAAILREMDPPVGLALRRRIATVMKRAAVVGACAERNRAIRIIREELGVVGANKVSPRICERSVLDVLGYTS